MGGGNHFDLNILAIFNQRQTHIHCSEDTRCREIDTILTQVVTDGVVNHPTTKLEYSPFFRKLQDLLTTTPPSSDQFLYIAVNTSVSLCYIMHARSRAFQGPVPFLKLLLSHFYTIQHGLAIGRGCSGQAWASLM